jgi:hypothetical protein
VSTGEFLVRAVACIKVAGSEVAGQPIRVDDEQSPVIDLLDNGLMVVYLVDEGDRFVYVQHKHANAIKADPRGLLDFGLANLSRLAEAKLKLFRHGAIHGLQLDGQFEASLILLDKLWDEALAQFTPHGAIVAIPARDVLAFCDADDTAGIAELRALAQRVTAVSDHLLTPQLFRRIDGAWQPFEPHGGNP